jgi:hypothetical protein
MVNAPKEVERKTFHSESSICGKNRERNMAMSLLRPGIRRTVSVNGSPADASDEYKSSPSTSEDDFPPLFFKELSKPTCGFLGFINGLSSLRKQVAFAGGKGVIFPNSIYSKFIEVTKYDGNKKRRLMNMKDGYTAQDFRYYLQTLKKENIIKSYTFKSLYKWLPHMIFDHSRDHPILVFGCTTSDQKRRNTCKRLVNEAYIRACLGGPVQPNVAAMNAYGLLAKKWDDQGKLRCGVNFTYHAVSFRWLNDPQNYYPNLPYTTTKADNRRGKCLWLFDSGKTKPKKISGNQTNMPIDYAKFNFDEVINSLTTMHYFYAYDITV